MEPREIARRIKNGIDLLKAGTSPVQAGAFAFAIEDEKKFTIIFWTSAMSVDELTKQLALKELAEARKLFDYLLSISDDLREFTEQREVIYRLTLRDEKEEIPVCEDVNGKTTWKMELNDH